MTPPRVTAEQVEEIRARRARGQTAYDVGVDYDLRAIEVIQIERGHIQPIDIPDPSAPGALPSLPAQHRIREVRYFTRPGNGTRVERTPQVILAQLRTRYGDVDTTLEQVVVCLREFDAGMR